MTPNDVRDKLQQNPFTPFRIRMNNGDTYAVQHRDFIFVTKTAVLVYDQASPTDDVPDNRATTLSLRNISSLEPMDRQVA